MRASPLVTASFVLAATAALCVAGCGSSNSSGTGGSSSAATTGGSSGTGGKNPCDPANIAACDVARSVTSACLALEDYTGKPTTTLRMMDLQISKPTSLTDPVVQDQVVNPAVTLNLPVCNLGSNEATSLNGNFNWLLQFDFAAKTLKTGGAKPVPDPLQGYTFAIDSVSQHGTTFDIKPVVLDLVLDDSGGFSVAKGLDLVVPIYQDRTATTFILLPLHEARISMGKLSSDHECIGVYNGPEATAQFNCMPSPPYNDGASIDGFITLEEADQVDVLSANATLCALLAKVMGGTGSEVKCPRVDGKISFKGDWCSTTNTANGCADSMKLEATFAAAAVKLNP